jgi:hypothetical protein
VSLLACEKDSLGSSEGIPLGTMVFFGAEECPDDWGVTIGAGGRFVIGIGGNGSQGAVFGSDPIKPDKTSFQHEHGVSGPISLPAAGDPSREAPPGSASFPSASTEVNGYVGTADPVTSELPYLVLQACTYTAGQARQRIERPGQQ